MTTTEPFYVIGLAVRTTNENNQSAEDIPLLWNKFFSENVLIKIPGRISDTLYCIYTDYELDHTKPYTTLLGCRVKDIDSIPGGLTGKLISGGNCKVITAKGKIAEGIVFHEWTKIWNSDIPRAFTADFEVYDERAQNPDAAEIDIFIAVK